MVFDGAGHLISGASGFGDSPPQYTGRQEWPELVGRNAKLVKAQLVAETHLQVFSGSLSLCILAISPECCLEPGIAIGTVHGANGSCILEEWQGTFSQCDLQVILVPAGSAVTSEYRTDRIRIFYDPATFVVVQPRPSIG